MRGLRIIQGRLFKVKRDNRPLEPRVLEVEIFPMEEVQAKRDKRRLKKI